MRGATLNLSEMILVTALLIALLAAGLFLAVRELVGFQPSPEWRDVNKLRDTLNTELPPPPHHAMAERSSVLRYCLGLRREFRSAWRLCRFLAPITGDPGYIGTLIVLKLRFYAVLSRASFCAVIGSSARCSLELDRLLELSSAMRASALAILMSSDLDHGFTPA